MKERWVKCVNINWAWVHDPDIFLYKRQKKRKKERESAEITYNRNHHLPDITDALFACVIWVAALNFQFSLEFFKSLRVYINFIHIHRSFSSIYFFYIWQLCKTRNAIVHLLSWGFIHFFIHTIFSSCQALIVVPCLSMMELLFSNRWNVIPCLHRQDKNKIFNIDARKRIHYTWKMRIWYSSIDSRVKVAVISQRRDFFTDENWDVIIFEWNSSIVPASSNKFQITNFLVSSFYV